ncbi:hypothetical protein HDU77_006207 [Chytriomyces hyalinus]|nr:hypothetical protein HDU77_006207 [Chytriomyces hyalinus]
MSLQSIVVQATKPHTATFIFLHGLGDSGHGWSQLGEMLSPMFPHVKFVFPNAPSIPITLNGGYRMPGWYDIMSLDPKTRKEDESGMLQTVEIINKLLTEEISGGIKSKRIVLGGFSQGSAMSLLTSIKTDIKLGGIVGFSGYLPLADKAAESATSANQWTPYFMGHGDVDEVVAFEWGRMSADKLKESMGRQVTFKTYKGMGHSYCNQEVSDLAKFLGEAGMDFKHDAVMEYGYGIDGSDTEDDGDALSFTQGDDEVWRSDSDETGDSDDSEDFDLLNPVAFSYIEGSLMAPVHCVHVRAAANSDMLGLAFMTTQKLTEERKLKDFAIFKLITMQNALRHVYSLLETGDLDSPSSATDDTMSPTDELPSQTEEAQTTDSYDIESPRRMRPYRSKSVIVSQLGLPTSPDMTERGYSSADDAFSNIKKQSKTLIRIRQPEKFTVRKRSIPAKLVIERDAYATHVATSLKHSPKNASIVIPARTASSSSVNFVRDVDLRPLPPVPWSPDSPPQSIMEALLDSAPVRPSASKTVKAPSSPTSDVIGSVRRKLSAFGPSSKIRSNEEENTTSVAKVPSPTLTPPVNAIVSSAALERQNSESRDSRRYNRITPAHDVPFPSREIAKNLEMKSRRITNGTLATVATTATTATTVSTNTSSSGADVDLNLRDSILSNSRDSTLSLSTVSSRSRRSVVDYEFAFDFDQSESVEMETVRRKSVESKKRKSKASRLSVIVTVDDEIKMEGYHHYARNRKSKLTETGGDSAGRAAPPLPQAPPLNPDGTVKIMKRTDSLSANSKAIVVESMVFDITGLEPDALNVDLGQSTKQQAIPSLAQLLERPPRDSSTKPVKQDEWVPTPPSRTPFKELDLGRKNLQPLSSSQETQQPRALGRPLPAQLFSSTSLPLNFKSDFNSKPTLTPTLSVKPSKPHSPVPMSVTLSREVEAHLQKQLAPNSSIATGPREGTPRQGVKPGSLSKQEQLLQQGSLPALNTFSAARRDSSASSTSSSSSATTAGDLSRRQQPAIQARTKSLFIDMSPFEGNRSGNAGSGVGGGVIRRGSDSSEMHAGGSTALSPSLPPRRDSMLKKVISEPQGLNQHTLVGGRSMSPVSAAGATRRQAVVPFHASKVAGEPGVGVIGGGELASSQPSIPHRSSSRFVSQD